MNKKGHCAYIAIAFAKRADNPRKSVYGKWTVSSAENTEIFSPTVSLGN